MVVLSITASIRSPLVFVTSSCSVEVKTFAPLAILPLQEIYSTSTLFPAEGVIPNVFPLPKDSS